MARRRRSTPRALGAGGCWSSQGRESPPTHSPISTHRGIRPAPAARGHRRRLLGAPRGGAASGGMQPRTQGVASRAAFARFEICPRTRKMPPRAHTAGKIMQIHTQPSRFDCFSLAISRTSRLANSLIPPETFSSARLSLSLCPNRISIISSARVRNWIIPGRFLSPGIFHVRMV